MTQIYIRPLTVKDASVSFRWRNNPNIWELTGSKPDMKITYKIEYEWITRVLNRKNESRFAICVTDTGQYIGNVQLTNINEGKAEFHIFIGEMSFWGKGIGTLATKLMLEHGFYVLGLKEIILWVNEQNQNAIIIYMKYGFVVRELIKWIDVNVFTLQ